MPMCMRPRSEGRLKGPKCAVCGPWPVELRAAMRVAIEAIPLREDVCDECVKAWWHTLPKGPPIER